MVNKYYFKCSTRGIVSKAPLEYFFYTSGCMPVIKYTCGLDDLSGFDSNRNTSSL